MCIPNFKILAIIVSEKTVTQKKSYGIKALRSYVITELGTNQIQYSPTFSKWGDNKFELLKCSSYMNHKPCDQMQHGKVKRVCSKCMQDKKENWKIYLI